MVRGIFFALIWAVLTIAAPKTALAEERIALVIGNSAYQTLSPLNNPTRDAEAIGANLSALDFTVFLATDLDRIKMTRTVRFFAERARTADVALIYFAGHGAQINGVNYLLPTDFGRDMIFDTANALDLDDLLAAFGSQLSTTIVIIDACLEQPEDIQGGPANLAWESNVLQSLKPRIGTLVSYATTPGKVAYDGTALHSPFTGALLDHLSTPLLDIELMLRNVRRDVVVNSKGQQTPTTLSSLLSEFQLLPQGLVNNQHLLATPRQTNLDLAAVMSEKGFNTKPVLQDVAAGVNLPQDLGTAGEIAERIRLRQADRSEKRQNEVDDLRALICRRLAPPRPSSCLGLAGASLLEN